MEKVDTLVLDKTGTLTEGKPRMTQIIATGSVPENDLLRLVASLERSSEHPLAASIVRAAEERELKLSAATNFESIPGKGVIGRIDGREVAVGNASFLPRGKSAPISLATPKNCAVMDRP